MKYYFKRVFFHKGTSLFMILASVSMFLYSSYGLINTFYHYKKSEKEYIEVQHLYQDTKQKQHLSVVRDAPQKTLQKKKTKREFVIQPQFKDLLKQNEETIGWITIEDTKIDYPVMQTDNNQDYLRKGFNGEYSIVGSLFLDYRNDVKNDDERNFIIYGHRVKDGSMFEHLTKYLDEDFYKSHRTFTFDTLYDEYEAEVFAVYNTMIDFNYIQTDFTNEKEYEQLLSEIKKRSIYDVDVNINASDQILTLSTCEYTLHPDDSRLVVHAKLTKK